MAKYSVRIEQTAIKDIEVWANDPETAINLALEKAHHVVFEYENGIMNWKKISE